MSYTLAYYRPMKNSFLDMSALKEANGDRIFDYMLTHSNIKRVRIGIRQLDYQPSGKKATSYVFYHFAELSKLSSFEVPYLSSINCNYVFDTAFNNCSELSSIEFPSLVSIGTSTNSNWYGSRVFTNAWQRCAHLTSVSFPELSSIDTHGEYTFYQCLYNDINGASAWPICDMYFPKLYNYKTSGSGPIFY